MMQFCFSGFFFGYLSVYAPVQRITGRKVVSYFLYEPFTQEISK